MGSNDREIDEIVARAFEEGKNAGRESSMVDGANIGIVNGSLVGYDVGYWNGFSTELLRLLENNAGETSSDTRRLSKIKQCCQTLRKATDGIRLNAEETGITERLKEIKTLVIQ